MRFIYHPDALAEYTDAALYYEERTPGLGADFTREVETAIQCILEAPDRWRRMFGGFWCAVSLMAFSTPSKMIMS